MEETGTGSGSGLETVVGGRVTHYRRRSGMTSAELAARAGLSAAMVSRIESASTSASLTTIARVAEALEVPVASLFRGADAHRPAVFVRAGAGHDQARPGSADGHRYATLGSILPMNGATLEPVIVAFSEHATEFPMYEHQGVEFLLMLEGTMRFRHGDDEYEMSEGDSILLDAEAPHGPVAVLAPPVRYLTVNTSGG